MECLKLTGHRSSINDIALSAQNSPLLASASEDGTVRVWDQRCNKAIKCYREFFSSPPQLVQFSSSDPRSLFAACDNDVYELDLGTDGVLIRSSIRALNRDAHRGSDINTLTTSPGAVAIGDDDGRGCIFAEGRDEPMVLEGAHSNLVGSVALSTTGETRAAYSGGFDSLLVRWDIDAGVESKSFNFASHYTGATNPPFLHAIDVVSLEQPDDHLVCALGNGLVCLMDSMGLTPCAAVEASGGMISSIVCEGRRVCSAGNGGTIKLFKITETESADPTPKLTASEKRRLRRKGKATKTNIEYSFEETLSFMHAGKVNAICGRFEVDATKLYVADTSPSIHCYTL